MEERHPNPVVQYAFDQQDLFHKDPQVYVETLVRGGAMLKAMIWAYQVCVSQKLFDPIEARPTDEKIMWWERAKAIAEGRLSKEKLVDFSKILYMLG